MSGAAPIFLYTDFGSADLYVGQVKAVLLERAPGCCVIDLLNDAPGYDVPASAHLLSALVSRLPPGSVTLAVVDPGVGSARGAVALEADGRWFVGPDNGLLSVVASRSQSHRCYTLDGMPAPASASFHGRDLFAPAAARLATTGADACELPSKSRLDVELDAEDVPRIVYIDHYGNAMTGLRAGAVNAAASLEVAGRAIKHARVFSDVPPGQLFWYENSIGLIEIAANRASAAGLLHLDVGGEVVGPER